MMCRTISYCTSDDSQLQLPYLRSFRNQKNDDVCVRCKRSEFVLPTGFAEQVRTHAYGSTSRYKGLRFDVREPPKKDTAIEDDSDDEWKIDTETSFLIGIGGDGFLEDETASAEVEWIGESEPRVHRASLQNIFQCNSK
jgi:hypothetical protein